MCMGKDLFLNRRTRQPGYIEVKNRGKLSQTQRRDLVQVVYWIKCKYNFTPKDIADFLGVSIGLVKDCLEEPNPVCYSCTKKLKKPSWLSLEAKN